MSRNNRVVRRAWIGVWAVLVVAQLFMLYTPDLGGGPGILAPLWDLLAPLPGPTAPSEPGFDKIAHAIAFGAVTATGLLAGWPRWFAIGLPVLHAPASELIQWAWIAGRGGEWGDLLANWSGVLIAVILIGALPGTRDSTQQSGTRT